MNNDVQYLSPFMFAAAILAVLSAAAVIRLISKTFSRRRALRHLRHDSGTDDEGKLLFKQKIRRCYMVEEHRNREKLKRQITKGIMLAQTYQFQKLRHTDITHIIRRTLLNFRYRFFTNLRLALTEFEDAESGEITPKVSAGQGKKIRIRPDKWACGVAEAKRLLPQYTIARKPQGLKGENAEMYGRKLAEFGELCRGEREERKTDND